MDLIIRNARLRDAADLQDIAVNNGRIAAIAAAYPGRGREEIEAGGNLAIPPFCDPHLHLDAALSVGDPSFNESGTLLEGIKIWGERRPKLTQELVLANAKEAVLWEFAHGAQFIRTHADTTDPRLVTVQALLELKDSLKDLVDIQVVAFPQDGLFTRPGHELVKSFERALDMGVDAVGGIPHAELTRDDGVRQLEYVFAQADKRGLLVDVHCDETGDEHSRFVETLLQQTIMRGLGARVTASHTTAMHNYNNNYALKLINIAARARANFITCPFCNSVLENRVDGYPRRRGHTRVDELDAAGVNVSIASDCIMDPWYPLGVGSVLQAANLLLHTAHLSTPKQISRLLDMITDNTAVTLQVEKRYGLTPGKPANLIILDAESDFEAIRRQPVCLYVLRQGKVAMRGKPAELRLDFPGWSRSVDFRVPR